MITITTVTDTENTAVATAIPITRSTQTTIIRTIILPAHQALADGVNLQWLAARVGVWECVAAAVARQPCVAVL